MKQPVSPEKEIVELKDKLEQAAKQHGYDFGHPKVLQLSRELDRLILRMMKVD